MSLRSTSDYLDLVLLEHYLNSLGRVVVEQMFDLYCQQVTLYMADIEKANADKCITEWRHHCHKMKGAAGSVGLTVLSETLKKLETIDLSELNGARLTIDLKRQNDQSITAFRSWLQLAQ